MRALTPVAWLEAAGERSGVQTWAGPSWICHDEADCKKAEGPRAHNSECDGHGFDREFSSRSGRLRAEGGSLKAFGIPNRIARAVPSCACIRWRRTMECMDMGCKRAGSSSSQFDVKQAGSCPLNAGPSCPAAAGIRADPNTSS